MNNKLREALAVIKEECTKHTTCDDCPLSTYVSSYLVCGVQDCDPCNWKMNTADCNDLTQIFE